MAVAERKCVSGFLSLGSAGRKCDSNNYSAFKIVDSNFVDLMTRLKKTVKELTRDSISSLLKTINEMLLKLWNVLNSLAAEYQTASLVKDISHVELSLRICKDRATAT